MKKVAAFLLTAMVVTFTSFAVAQETPGIQSDTALPFMIDIEKTAGWMVYFEGGYQWNFFRGVGVDITDRNRARANRRDFSSSRNFTKGGAAGAVALGYNFCPRAPITLGLKIGVGPSNKLESTTALAGGGSAYSWQKIGLYTLDFALDYDFRNRSRYTPFVGINFGAALVSQKARATYLAGDGSPEYYGKYDTRRRVNFMGGVRTGVKYDLTNRVALTLFGQYSYLGSLKGKNFEMSNGVDVIDARTKKVRAHMVEAKLGVRIAF